MGSDDAKRAGCDWIDNDGHLSRVMLGSAWAWINAHGAPETIWLEHGDKFEHHDAAWLLKLHRVVAGHVYQLRDAAATFRDNHRNGLGTEWEVKNLSPWTSPAILAAAFARLSTHARQVYGPHWQARVNVKVVSTMPGALEICRAAHAAGIPTLLTVRGRDRFKRYAGHGYITFVRGSSVVIGR